MLDYPQIDPVAIALGPVKVYWYGLMYVVGFIAAWWLGRLRAARLGLKPDDIGDMLFYGALGVVLGGRIGYVLFYGFERLLADPLWLFQVWDGGMSFHGGLIGVLIATLLFARKHRLGFFQTTDFIGADRPGRGPHRQLHQCRTAGARQRPALGDGLSGGQSTAPPLVAL